MTRTALAAAIAMLTAVPASAEQPPCEFCMGENPHTNARPLRIEIESGLRFSRLALVGREDGAARIDPLTGQKHVGSNMIDLGGMSFHGEATVTGEPHRPVRIELPPRVILRSPEGTEATLTEFVTNLPPVAMLDENGTLKFSFGARLSSEGGQGGHFRGRIPIHVDYF